MEKYFLRRLFLSVPVGLVEDAEAACGRRGSCAPRAARSVKKRDGMRGLSSMDERREVGDDEDAPAARARAAGCRRRKDQSSAKSITPRASGDDPAVDARASIIRFAAALWLQSPDLR